MCVCMFIGEVLLLLIYNVFVFCLGVSCSEVGVICRFVVWIMLVMLSYS